MISLGTSNALFERALPFVEPGVRYKIQPRFNLRIDFEYAPSPAGSHTGAYFNFTEAYKKEMFILKIR